MLRSRALLLLVPALLGSCADSCACGKKATPTGSNTGPSALTPKPASPPAQPQRHALEGQAGAAPPPANPLGGAAWEPAPPSPATDKLAASKQAIETDRMFSALASEKSLSAVLRDKLGKLKAAAPASVASRGDGQVKLAIVARDYAGADAKNVRVKVTDTGLLPNARHTVSNRLTLIGNAATGNERGVFVRNAPAVVGYFETDRVSRAIALFGERFLVEVTVRGATDKDEALRVLEQVDVASLSRNSK